jgi:hypothetical protein
MKINNPREIKFPCIVSRDEWDFWSKKAHFLGYKAYSGRSVLEMHLFNVNPNLNYIEIINNYITNQNPKTLIYKELDSLNIYSYI